MSRPRRADRKFWTRGQDRIARARVKARSLVGVIANLDALKKAQRLRVLPDFFELRLDALCDRLDEIERAIPLLRAPLIFTARDPAEGGCNRLSESIRRKLLERFRECAAFLDLEFGAAKNFDSLGKKAGLILSHHDLRDTPSPAKMREQFEAAISLGADVFKIATRTESRAQLFRLLDFFETNSADFPIAAMGLGRLGPEARRRLLRAGSVLNYGSIGAPNAPGQITLAQLRCARRAYSI
jgi:3-dehydroquinate dehydratase-1